MKTFFVYAAVTAFGMLFVTGSAFADNVAIDLSEDGTLSLVGDRFFEGNQISLPDITITVKDGLLTVHGRFGTTLNGQDAALAYNTADISAISVTGIYQLFFNLTESLVADLSIEAVDVHMYETPVDSTLDSIIGHTSFVSGRAAMGVFIRGIGFVGDVDFETGHGDEIISIGRDLQGRAGRVVIQGNLSMNTGHGECHLETYLTDIYGDVLVELGQGNDLFGGGGLLVDGNVYLSGGQGYDSSYGPAVVTGEFVKIGFEN